MDNTTETATEAVEVTTEEVTEPVNPKFVTLDTLFPIVWGESWKQLSAEDRDAFRTLLAKFTKGAARLRSKFDSTVWAGHSDGTIPLTFESIRTKSDGDKPGRKAKVKTEEEILFDD